jgi:hypothetical protein
MSVNDLIQIRKGTSAAWTSANPVLASGEPGYDLTNKIFKIGDGSSNWASLASINLTSSNITDFGTATSGILPVKNIVAGNNITISSSSGTYTINSTASGTGGGSSSTSVIEYGTVSNFPASGVGSTIYISTDTGRIYRWAGSVYQELGPVSYAPVGSDSRWNSFLPPAPTGIILIPGDSLTSVSWAAPVVLAQTPITDYSVQYSSNSGLIWTTFPHTASTGTSLTITGLTNNTNYSVKIAAINTIGIGTYSTSSNVTPSLFTPAQLSGLQLWLDANDSQTFYDSVSGGSLTVNDGTVARWQDKSGNNRHATQSSTGLPYRRSAGYLDFAPGYMRIPISAFPFSSDFALFIVAATPSIANAFCYQDNSAQYPIIRFDNSTNNILSIALRGVGGNARSSSSVNVGTGFYLVSIVRTGGLFQTYINQNLVSSVTDSASYTPTVIPAIMSYVDNATPPTNGTGKYGEIISYSTAISSNNQSIIESYLKKKWSIT